MILKKLSKMDRIMRILYGGLLLFMLTQTLNPVFLLGIIPILTGVFEYRWFEKIIS